MIVNCNAVFLFISWCSYLFIDDVIDVFPTEIVGKNKLLMLLRVYFKTTYIFSQREQC